MGPTSTAVGPDVIDVTATNTATAVIDAGAPHADCNVAVNVTTDGPITSTFLGSARWPGADRPSPSVELRARATSAS